MTQEENVEGYVVDIACLRKYPRADMLARARAHSKDCALMGHCVESGYGLVSEGDALQLLEPAATPRVVAALRGSDKANGIRVKARRELRDGEMRTVEVEEIS